MYADTCRRLIDNLIPLHVCSCWCCRSSRYVVVRTEESKPFLVVVSSAALCHSSLMVPFVKYVSVYLWCSSFEVCGLSFTHTWINYTIENGLWVSFFSYFVFLFDSETGVFSSAFIRFHLRSRDTCWPCPSGWSTRGVNRFTLILTWVSLWTVIIWFEKTGSDFDSLKPLNVLLPCI